MLIYRRSTKTWGKWLSLHDITVLIERKMDWCWRVMLYTSDPLSETVPQQFQFQFFSPVKFEADKWLIYFTCFTVKLGWWNSPLLYSTRNNRCTCYRVSWVLSNVDKSAYSQSETRIHPQGPNFYLGCLHWTKDGIVSAMVNWPTYTLFQRSDWCIVSK